MTSPLLAWLDLREVAKHHARVETSSERMLALLDLKDAVAAWIEAECTHVMHSEPSSDLGFHGCGDGEQGNHDAACPVELAHQDVINASNKLEAL